MPEPVYLYFVKFFSDETHADEFRAGKVYANKLSYFRHIEDGPDGRADPNETPAAHFQHKNVSIIFVDNPHLNITPDNLIAPVTMSYRAYDSWHLFCLCAIYVTGYDLIDGNIEINDTKEDKSELERQLRIDEKCANFGRFAVIVLANRFMEQLDQAMRKIGKKYHADLVQYYDPSTFHGYVPIQQAPFRKQHGYSYQREYRICFPNTNPCDGALSLNIGDISTFSAKYDSIRINDLLKISYK